MFKSTVTSLFTLYHLSQGQPPPVVPAIPENPSAPAIPGLNLAPAGQMYGAFGQFCKIPANDVGCRRTTDIVTSQNPGFTKCEKDYDCCLCSSVSCGDINQGCTVFSAGNYGIYGLKNVAIHGQAAGAHINCIGEEACAESEIVSSLVKDITGASLMALKNAKITVSRPLDFFSLDCIDIDSCDGLQLEIIIPPPPAGYTCGDVMPETLWFNQISCVNSGSCRNMDVTIRNEGCRPIVIGKLSCVQPDSCDGANFNLIGDVQFNNCNLRSSAGTLTTGIDTCFDHLTQLLCSDPTSCRDAVQTLLNPLNSFLMSCGNTGSCQDSVITIDIDSTAPALVTYFEGFKFSAQYSGAGATVIINNKQNGVVLNIQRIECSTVSSCAGAVFIIGHDVSVGEIVCGPGACHGCIVKIDALSPGIPCDPNDIGNVLNMPPPPGSKGAGPPALIPLV